MNTSTPHATQKLDRDHWLYTTDPLTDQLKKRNQNVHLEVLSEHWQARDWWMRECLQIESERVWTRNIVMKADARCCWYAKTLIPEDCYTLKPAFFKRLEHETMRQLIYDEPLVKRVQHDVFSLDASMIPYYWVKNWLNDDQPLWCRLATFRFMDQSHFYLFEIFLPDMWNES